MKKTRTKKYKTLATITTKREVYDEFTHLRKVNELGVTAAIKILCLVLQNNFQLQSITEKLLIEIRKEFPSYSQSKVLRNEKKKMLLAKLLKKPNSYKKVLATFIDEGFSEKETESFLEFMKAGERIVINNDVIAAASSFAEEKHNDYYSKVRVKLGLDEALPVDTVAKSGKQQEVLPSNASIDA